MDDNPDILIALRTLLKFSGYEVETADRGEQVQGKIAAFAPDVILLDIMLSGTSGCDLCKSLKQSDFHKDIPVIMISAHPYAEELALKCGANDFLPKPFDMHLMLAKIKSYIKEQMPISISA